MLNNAVRVPRGLAVEYPLHQVLFHRDAILQRGFFAQAWKLENLSSHNLPSGFASILTSTNQTLLAERSIPLVALEKAE
jgi:hypothetical protein